MDFGVSGKLYKRNVLLYDRKTDSLWSQVKREAVTGPMTGTELETIPLMETTWADWRQKHPDTLVLSKETGYDRDYERDPYGIQQERALGVFVDDRLKVYPFEDLVETGDYPIQDTFRGQPLRIHFDPKSQEAWATDSQGNSLDYFVSYLSAFQDFYPDSVVWDPE